MGSIPAIAASGMRAAQQGVQVAAHNVANLVTPEAERLRLERSGTAEGGVATTVGIGGEDPTAPVADLVAARSEVLAFKANAMVLRRSDEMVGSLLDIRA
jgi:flagellar basal body rod protein FlgC